MGVEISKKGSNKFFRCINPEHEDKHPSTSIGKNGNYYFCFSCATGGDIFTAASILEQKPLQGAAFITENVQYLLNKYNIEHEPIELTEEQLSNYRYETIYNSVYELMIVRDPETSELIYSTLEHAEKRGWKDSTCERYGIVTIKDYDTFITALSNKTRVSIEELQSAGIHRKLFGPDLITFCIRDHNHIPRGFVARYIPWEKGCSEEKYRNTSIENNPFYRKEKILYLLNEAKRYKDMRLDIYEGYGSAITAHQAGIRNSCSIGGTAFTEHHVDLIRKLGFRHINLVLDADSTGTAKMDRYIDKFSGYNGLEVTITHLPFSEEELSDYGKNDPDYYIQTYGVEAYRANKPIGFFEHMLNKTPVFEESDPLSIDFCYQIIPLIVNEPQILRRSDMIKALSKHTGIDKDEIRAEIQKIETSDVEHNREKTIRELRNAKSADDVQQILSQGLNRLQDTSSTKKDRYLISLAETIDQFDEIFTDMNSAREGIHGWKTGFSAFDELLDGVPKPGVKTGGRMIGFAGAAQHAKSATLLNIITKLVQNPSNDDLTVLFWAIDDNRKTLAYRLISMLSGVEMRKVNHMKKRDPDDERAIKEAQDLIRSLIIDRKLVIKDDKFGRSKTKAENWIKDTQDQTSNHILFCVDSLHNVEGKDGQETRTKIMGNSSWLKQLTTSTPCTVLTTIELVKNRGGEKPNLQNISETVKVEYDFDSICICWNEQQGKYTTIDNPSVKAKWGSPGSYKPIIELDFQKNKCGAGDKGSLYFKFDSDTTSFIDCTKYPDFLENFKEVELEGNNGVNFKFTRGTSPKKQVDDSIKEW